ncbi:MAG: ABC transporter permease subunit [Clostridia bacterium]|nr:ABC transporter permease subunit [Clostridia bacterium]
MKNFKKIGIKASKVLLIALFWLGIWELVSLILNIPMLFPGPISVLKRLFELILTKEFIINSLMSLLRVFGGIFIAIILGVILAAFCAMSKIVHDIIYPILTVIKSTPVASFVIVIWLFLGDQKTPIIITVMMMLPIVWANIYQGIKNVDKNLLEVCTVYKIPFKKRVSAFYAPSIIPYFISSLLSGIGLAWKAGIAAEVLCSTDVSIGDAIFDAKYDFNGVDLFAWTVTVIILSLVFELVFTKLLKKLLKKYIKSEGGSNENK